MFDNKFIVSVKVDGKFLREDCDQISLPFGSEYSIYMKNTNSKQAVVNISVDGKDVCDGQRIVISPNSALELEGFMSSSVAKNKFKFIERTKQIEEYKGITPEDGLIRIEVWYEKDRPQV